MTQTQPEGYLAQPSDGSGAPVLVLHAWWGLNDTIKTICDQLAAEGFLVFAPDLYHGQTATDIPTADELSTIVFTNPDVTRREVDQAAAFLLERAGHPEGGLAVLGFSLGAFFALDLSVRQPELVHAVVSFYGTGPGDFSSSHAAYLCHFAEEDEFEGPDEVAALSQALQAAGRPATIHHYPNTGHWFFEPDRSDAYNAAAAQLAWERTLAFLRGESA